MKIIKRSGEEVLFDVQKIARAVEKCRDEAIVKHVPSIDDADCQAIAKKVEVRCQGLGRTPSVEEVQDMVEEELLLSGAGLMMRLYTNYRQNRAQQRAKNTIDAELGTLLEHKNEEAIQENSNKNPILSSTLRDYMAGVVSKDWCRRKIFSSEIMAAHDEGIIHIHDMDYVAMPGMFNCCLVDLDDMLQNGTCISKTLIEKPHSFSTACTVATQIVSGVASAQYGKVDLPFDTNYHNRVLKF